MQSVLLWNPVQSLSAALSRSQSQQLLRGRPLVSHWTQEECHWRQRRCCQQGQWTPALEFSSEWLDRRLRWGLKKWGVGVERMPHMMWSFPTFLLFKPFICASLHFFRCYKPRPLNYDRKMCCWPVRVARSESEVGQTLCTSCMSDRSKGCPITIAPRSCDRWSACCDCVTRKHACFDERFSCNCSTALCNSIHESSCNILSAQYGLLFVTCVVWAYARPVTQVQVLNAPHGPDIIQDYEKNKKSGPERGLIFSCNLQRLTVT